MGRRRRSPAPCPAPPAPRPLPLAPGVLASALALILGASGCSASYRGERLFWHAQRLSAPIAANPGQAGPEQFARATEAFQEIVRKMPGTTWAAKSLAAIGSLQAMQQRFGEAMESYHAVLRDYGHERDTCLQTRIALAKLYELQNDWDRALAMYKELAVMHPWSRAALETPLYIGQWYEQHQDPARAEAAYRSAVSSYDRLLQDAPTNELTAQAKAYLALAHQELGQWQQSITILEELVKSPSGSTRPLALLTLGSLYQAKARRPEKAEAAYSVLAEEFPEHPFGKVAKLKLQHLHADLAPATQPIVAVSPK